MNMVTSDMAQYSGVLHLGGFGFNTRRHGEGRRNLHWASRLKSGPFKGVTADFSRGQFEMERFSATLAAFSLFTHAELDLLVYLNIQREGSWHQQHPPVG